MKIRSRLALFFTLLSSALLLLIMAGMYFSFAYFFHEQFYERLFDRAEIAAGLYLEADELPTDSLNRLKERMLVRLPHEVIRIYDSRNRSSFLQHPQPDWNAAIINRIRQTGKDSFTEGGRQTVGLYYHDNQGDYVILTSATDIHGPERLTLILEVMGFTFILVNMLLFFIGRWFADRALRPISRLEQEMRRISASQLHVRAAEGNGKDEISSLARSFNKLLQHLQNSFELQQTFVANASHELRTPLTSITGEIELALKEKRSVTEYEQLLRSVLGDTARLKDTVKGLMELAQTDMEYTRAQTQPVAMDELLWELQHNWSGKPFKVSVAQLPEDQRKLTVRANPELLKIALNNIISNAFKFSADKPVNCTLMADGEQIVFKIEDWGIGILPEDMARIAQPFHRGKNSLSFEGSGIGLYVSFMILRLFNSTVEIDSNPGSGTKVTVRFTPDF